MTFRRTHKGRLNNKTNNNFSNAVIMLSMTVIQLKCNLVLKLNQFFTIAIKKVNREKRDGNKGSYED